MLSSAVMFLLADAVFLGAILFLIVAAFRVRVLYGFLVMLVPFAGLVFAIKYPKEGGVRFVVSVLAWIAMTFIAATSPELKSIVGKRLPGVTLLAKALGTKDAPARGRPGQPPAPHEVRDLAENEPTSAPAAATPQPTADPNAAQRAAVVKHATELNAMYADLNKERATLKKGSPAVAAFNAKAAKYQEGLKALSAEQTQLAALDHPAQLPQAH